MLPEFFQLSLPSNLKLLQNFEEIHSKISAHRWYVSSERKQLMKVSIFTVSLGNQKEFNPKTHIFIGALPRSERESRGRAGAALSRGKFRASPSMTATH